MSIYTGTSGSDSVFALPDQTAINTLGGNDFISVWTPNGPILAVNAGDGDDQVAVQLGSDSSPIDLSITLGAGRDILKINDTLQKITVTDFATGDSGDILNFRWVLDQWVANYDNHSNPFAANGYFRLVQVGADTVLQIDRHMSTPGTWTDFVLFQNTQASTFTAANFTGAAPSGAAPVGQIIQGTGGNDTLYDTFGDDSIYGGAGNDNLYGGVGDDALDGGDGDDWITEDSTGLARLYGGAGNDILQVSHISWSPIAQSIAYIEGGTGDDRMAYTTHRGYGGTLTALGGEGDDFLTFSGATTATIDMGSGTDSIIVVPGGAFTITLGSGRDAVMLNLDRDDYQSAQPIHITDFEAGAAGDRLDLRTYMQFVGWNGVSSLIDNHYVELLQVGESTVVNIDRNGTARWQASFVLDNVKLADLTAFNLTGLTPSGAAPFNGIVVNAFNTASLAGGSGDDLVISMGSATTLSGGDGDDRLEGNTTSDILYGDNGNDILIASGGRDFLYGGNGNDLLDGGSGQDDLYGGAGDDILEGGADADALRGEAGFDLVSYATASTGVTVNLTTRIGTGGDAQNDTYFGIEGAIGSSAADILIGDDGVNILRGGGGDDVLTGAGGNDVLDGGAGQDIAVFAATLASSIIGVTAGGVTVRSSDGLDSLTGVEVLSFSDGALTITNLSKIASDYTEFFGRSATGSEALVWQTAFANGTSVGALRATLVSTAYGQAHIEAAITTLYQTYFGRAASADEVNVWKNAVIGGLGLAEVRSVLVSHPYGQDHIGAVTSSLYQAFFDRPATAGELTVWKTAITQGADFSDLRAALISDPYGQTHVTAKINDLYQTYFGRAATSSELTVWKDAYVDGLGFADTRAALVATAFGQAHIAAETNAVYQTYFGRAATIDEQHVWTDAIVAGASLGDVRATLVSHPYGQAHIAAETTALYQTYFGRAAASSELQVWKDAIVHGADFNTLTDALMSYGASLGVTHQTATSAADRFVFDSVSQDSVIQGFAVGQDVIELHGLGGDALAHAHAVTYGGLNDVMIDYPDLHILLKNVSLDSLQASDFLFT
jgi:Ca2+-binding RTX toxin-like protein